MRYDADSGKILISVGEFVAIARRSISPTLPTDEEEPTVRVGRGQRGRAADGTRLEMRYGFECNGIPFELYGAPEEITCDCIRLDRCCQSRPTGEDKAQCRGEAFVLAYMYQRLSDCQAPSIKIVYISNSGKESVECTEQPKPKALESFFEKCRGFIGIYAAPEIERVRIRQPSQRSARFPYKARRAGQEKFMHSVYKNLTRGGRLYACAPTGTGKTVSVLYPAIRALGDGRVTKVFYLTPKATTQQAARECLELFAEGGVSIKAVILTSKEHSCRHGVICRDGRSLCERSCENNLPTALLELYGKDKTVILQSDIEAAAEMHRVCPYELQLTYAEICDVVICDFNYLFDPRVYIRRFFTEGGDYAFLIDEAHNLCQRARQMYSVKFTLSSISEFVHSISSEEQDSRLRVLSDCERALHDELFPYLREELREDEEHRKVGMTHLSEIPGRIYEIFSELQSAAEDLMHSLRKGKQSGSATELRTVKDFLYLVKSVNQGLDIFDSCFKLFLSYEGDDITMKLSCLDPGGVIRTRLQKGRGAVFFSATLEPLEYYRAVLGGDGSSETLSVGSPFTPEQLSVSIVDKVSTRYSERERTLPAVCRIIAATMSARRGNYMVFSPSFEYSEELSKLFASKYPKIRTLVQTQSMTARERAEFIDRFKEKSDSYLVGFCVMGGIYSEGIDLAGESLIGAVVVGIGMPALSYEREAMAEYFEGKYESGKQYAYIYPGMNRVFQAAGRVIRREDDRGVIVLIDDRFDDPIYKKSIPDLWRGMAYIGSAGELKERIAEFWRGVDDEASREQN